MQELWSTAEIFLEAIAQTEVAHVLYLILVSCFCGGLIGLEREWRGKAAGIRTMMLIAGGSTLFSIVSSYAVVGSLGQSGDSSRVIAQIVTGIGFLGAGAIIHSEEGAIVGLTTAATIWMISAIGVIIGLGHVSVGVATALFVLLILIVFERLEAAVRHHQYRRYRVTVRYQKTYSTLLRDLTRVFNLFGVHNSQLIGLRQEGVLLRHEQASKDKPIDVELELSFPRRQFQAFLARIHSLDEVTSVDVSPLRSLPEARMSGGNLLSGD